MPHADYLSRNPDINELKRVTKHLISLFGTPKLIVCDRGRMFEASDFTSWMHVLGVRLHYITPEMHHANGQVERYIRTVLNILRIEANHKKTEWSDELWQLQLILNVTKQKTTQTSPLNLLVGYENATPAIRVLIRDVAQESSPTSREARRELVRQRAAERLSQNRQQQDAAVNEDRQPPRIFHKDDMVFVIKYSQSQGKLDPGMRGPYRVIRAMPNGRYELKLIAGAYGRRRMPLPSFWFLGGENGPLTHVLPSFKMTITSSVMANPGLMTLNTSLDHQQDLFRLPETSILTQILTGTSGCQERPYWM
ncbi:uncharacterized protein LOC126366473 [Pectinophora gossypiella]|uniref:uncharacterized protein LOC126366473 n=1 Tax=Pectinophora gossypiella TaxID=13191 RepID=UPI00214E8A2E|nr:uncharacterized protein LOC126366473 [Pectinophora gossypiella]